jgi:hypothetical protein
MGVGLNIMMHTRKSRMSRSARTTNYVSPTTYHQLPWPTSSASLGVGSLLEESIEQMVLGVLGELGRLTEEEVAEEMEQYKETVN